MIQPPVMTRLLTAVMPMEHGLPRLAVTLTVPCQSLPSNYMPSRSREELLCAGGDGEFDLVDVVDR